MSHYPPSSAAQRECPQSRSTSQTNGGNNGCYSSSSKGFAPTAASYNKTSFSQITKTTRTIYSPTATAIDNDQQDETVYFEKNRIQQLKDERIHIQKKTFTKWCNSYLNKVGGSVHKFILGMFSARFVYRS